MKNDTQSTDTDRAADQGNQTLDPVIAHMLVGVSECIRNARSAVRRAAASTGSLLVRGSRGSGRFQVARTLSQAGLRRGRPLSRLQCGRFKTTEAIVALFGAEGGESRALSRVGMLASAAGGIVYLEDVDALPLVAQRALVLFLEDGCVRPLGLRDPGARVDTRIVASSGVDLVAACRAGAFVPALLQRLSAHVIALEPLHRRRSDLMPLAAHFAQNVVASHGAPTLTEAAIGALLDYSWPGSVRELQWAVQYAVQRANAPTIDRAHLPPSVRRATPSRPPRGTKNVPVRS